MIPLLTEADTCRKYVLPKLYASGWTDDHINEQRTFTDGRIVVAGNRTIRRKQKRADYLLRYRPDFAIAIVEAKADFKKPADGLGQAMEYAQILGLKFAYSTNGHGIVEHDFTTGLESTLESFPSPDELWQRLKHGENIPSQIVERLLTPYYHLSGKSPRYYQEIAINSAIRAILQGQKRVLLTLATGTGKTVVAFQICYKLWNTKWNRDGDPGRRPRMLYLADRNILVDDPKDKVFAPFGDARHKIEREAIKSREMYFATYQAIAKDERRPGLYRDYPSRFARRHHPAIERPEVRSIPDPIAEITQPRYSGMSGLSNRAGHIEMKHRLSARAHFRYPPPARITTTSRAVSTSPIPDEIDVGVFLVCGPMPLEIIQESCPFVRQPVLLKVSQRE